MAGYDYGFYAGIKGEEGEGGAEGVGHGICEGVVFAGAMEGD